MRDVKVSNDLPRWLRGVMLVAAALNAFGAYLFFPSTISLRQVVGLSAEGHPFLFSVISAFILIFGLAYLAAGLSGRADPMFLLVAAAGKLAFFCIAGAYWAAGAFSLRVPVAAVSDLVFALIFLWWLFVRGRPRNDNAKA